MERRHNLLFALFILGASVLCTSIPVPDQEYNVEAFLENGNPKTLIFKIQPRSNNIERSQVKRQGRQEDEDEDNSNSGPGSSPVQSESESSTPYFIPAVIPALTKIFTGIITGNLNEIFHGSTSFAPQNISHAIDTVYNQVVGLAPPVSTPPTSRRPLFSPLFPAETSEPSTPSPPAPVLAEEEVTEAPVAPSVTVRQPLKGESLIVTTPKVITTSKPSSNEDDEDESDVDGIGFRRLRRRDSFGRRLVNFS